MDEKKLIEKARAAREQAIAPLTHFKVGAALEADDGTISTGCNVESPSAIVNICAERNALFHALSQGARHFRRVVTIADYAEPIPPCGVCRQALLEFAPEIEVVMTNLKGEIKRTTLKELVPGAYAIEKWGTKVD